MGSFSVLNCVVVDVLACQLLPLLFPSFPAFAIFHMLPLTTLATLLVLLLDGFLSFVLILAISEACGLQLPSTIP